MQYKHLLARYWQCPVDQVRIRILKSFRTNPTLVAKLQELDNCRIDFRKPAIYREVYRYFTGSY